MMSCRVAIVGTNIGSLLHVAAFRSAGCEVVLVGRDPERTKIAAARCGVKSSLSFDAALDHDTDAVVIATPPETHYALVQRAIATGKHVLCEKPFALDVAQAREMRDAAREAGVIGHVVHQLRWFDYARTVRELITSGVIGSPLQSSFIFDHSVAARGIDTMPAWWRHEDHGGGWLRNYASHGVDSVRFLLGEFEAVAASLHVDPARAMSADDGYSFLFRLVSGATGVMAGSCRAWDAYERSRIIAERATISFDNSQVFVSDADGTRAASIDGSAEGVPLPAGNYREAHDSSYGAAEQAALATAFRRRIEDPDYAHPSIATFDDGVAHMEVIAAVVAASRKGTWEAVR